MPGMWPIFRQNFVHFVPESKESLTSLALRGKSVTVGIKARYDDHKLRYESCILYGHLGVNLG